uniref:Peptidase S1 domain-containing protein n=1 Tax=Ciona savignyi TaxID=51511 RepID=H2YC28_CIOSA
ILESVSDDNCNGTHREEDVSLCPQILPCTASWGAWGSWEQCSSSCGIGVATSRRICGTLGGCRGESTKYRNCSFPPCWSRWTPFRPCTVSCGTGLRRKERRCVGTSDEYGFCDGNDVDYGICNTEECPVWGQWSRYGSCSKTCGRGVASRDRVCLIGSCAGPNTETRSCNLKAIFFFCPTWSPWSVYTCCSVSCGRGVQFRTRECNYGRLGEPGCIGHLNETIACNPGNCEEPPSSPPRPVTCGVRARNTGRRTALLKIFGGIISQMNSWPWQVSLQQHKQQFYQQRPKWVHFCGGTIISSRWIVTAAHCLVDVERHGYSGSLYSAVVGTYMLYTERNEQRYGFSRIFNHPQYSNRHSTFKHDVALVQLDGSVEWSRNVQPLCLPSGVDPSESETCYITGWGHTESNARDLSRELREAVVPVLSNKRCRRLGSGYNTMNMTLHLCAGDPVLSDRDTCPGDSGGPITCEREGHWYLAGVTSHSLESCGSQNHVGIYARVTAYERWIRNVMNTYGRPGC